MDTLQSRRVTALGTRVVPTVCLALLLATTARGAEPLASIPPALTGYNLVLGNGGNDLTYTYEADGERTGITSLLERLEQAGIRFKDLQTSESSLEDIFVNLVREARR